MRQNASKASPAAPPIEPRIEATADNAQATHRLKHFPIVGIGASAGGLEAMTQLLRQLPRDTGMGFVLVQHLDPSHESQLTALLSRLTPLVVTEARNHLPLERNHLYVIPPNRIMGVAGRRLKLLPRKGANDTGAPIDYFLRSLAEEEGSASIGVLLSGNGSDGTNGLQAIKAAGGITFAQEQRSAKYPVMPGNAIAAGCVDFVLPPERIAKELARIAGHPYIAPRETRPHRPPARTEGRALDDILATLRHCTGVDFTHYKHATLERRIQRRMVLYKHEKLKDYADYIHSHAAEAKELFNDILIHVTSFFRDPVVFAALKKRVFPRLLKGKKHGDPLRIWIPGCSTGEEVYSIAIALIESVSERAPSIPVQIFGTDINDLALERARVGTYPDSIHEDVSAERLRRFFVRHEGGYRINKSIRDLCIFARQNVVADPPFSNLDLISCRNVLIYFGQPLQRKIMPVFHYALKPTGLLMLGASETIGSFLELFHPLDKKTRIYSKKATRVRPAVSFGQFHPPPQDSRDPSARIPEARSSLSDVQEQADRIILTQLSPAGVVINQDLEVLQFRGRTGAFFEHGHGAASLNVIKIAREGLAVELRAAISKAMRTNSRVRQEGAGIKQNSDILPVEIEVIPFQLDSSAERFYLILLEAGRPSAIQGDHRRRKGRLGSSQTELNHLRAELSSSRESLQAIIGEQEATNEELRSANEEIMSSNEELQSTNEELETAKEELQSTNEELTTLNEELETRNLEMTHVNNDLHNVMSSVNIPLLILGRDMRIRRFTTAAEKMFNLIATDLGRPITDIAMKIDVPHLGQLVAEVIETLAAKEFETRDKNGHYWSARIRPYKTTDNKIDGATIALFDINVMKTGALQTEAARSLAEAVIDTVRESAVVLDRHLAIQYVNASFLKMFQFKVNEAVGQRLVELDGVQWRVPRLLPLFEQVYTQGREFHDFDVQTDSPRIGKRKLQLAAEPLQVERDLRMILLWIKDRNVGPAK